MDEKTMGYPTAKSSSEVDLTTLLFSVLHKTGQIVLAGVICAAMMIGFAAAKNVRAEKAAANADSGSISDAVQESYETEKENLLQKQSDAQAKLVSNESSQKAVRSSLQGAAEYLEHSVLYQLDPYAVYTAKAEYDLGGVQGSEADAILQAYASALSDSSVMEAAAKKLGMEARYLQELVTIEGGSAVSVLSDGSVQLRASGILTVAAYGATEQEADDALDAVLAQLNSVTKKVQSGAYPLRSLSRSSTVGVKADLRTQQDAVRKNVETLQSQLKDLTNDHDDLKDNVESITEELDALEPTEAIAGHTSLKKYAVVGLLMGSLVSAVGVFFAALFSNVVYSAKELRRSCGVTVLATMASDRTRRAGKFRKWVNKLEGRTDGSKDVEVCRLAAANIRNLAPDAKKVLVTGDLSQKQLTALARRLQAELGAQKVLTAESVLVSADSVQQAAAADAVVLAVDCTRSTYAHVRDQNEMLTKLGKPVLGCIVFE